MSLARLTSLVALLVPAVARAQFVTEGDQLDQPARQNIADTDYRGRLTLSTGVYTESGTDEDANGASPEALVWGDLRGKLDAQHISGSRFDALGDFRLRFTPAEARGWKGGNEFDLREAYLTARLGGGKQVVTLGRLILRDLDAMTVDGVGFGLKSSEAFEAGAAAGLFPNPFSRSLETDYELPADDQRGVAELPVGGGAWAGYRTATLYGSLGVGAIAPRNADTVPEAEREDTRTFVTARGYSRLTPLLAVFHYVVLDLTGNAGTNLTNAQVGLNWNVLPRLRLEAGYSHMSTYAIKTYLRDYFEQPDNPPLANVPYYNNLDLARMAADEGRVGGNYNFLESRLDVFAQVRLRRRDQILTDDLSPDIDAVPANNELDVSAGTRKRDAVAGWDLGANAAYLLSRRSTSTYVFLRGRHGFLDDDLDVDLDAGVILFEDRCVVEAPPPDPTCTGTTKGMTIRAGGQVVFIKDGGWLFLADYHFGYNTATIDQGGMMDVARPDILSHLGFFRGQYSF